MDARKPGPLMPRTNSLGLTGLFLCLWLSSGSAFGAEINVTLANGLNTLAEYRTGKKDKPAVLVLHGFLQTHRFSTIRLIENELSDAGYSVLSPTLTLNISQRRTSLTCDAIQNHTVEQSIDEIALWVNWLKQQGYKRIILIGHSTGSNRLLSYLHRKPDPAILSLIATAVGPIESWRYPDESRQQLSQARAAIATNDAGLKQYTLAFCHNTYTAPAKSYLSYRQWSSTHLLESLKSSPVPTTVVLGMSDKWLPPNWGDTIENASIPLVRIPEANHYFSGVAEFDFQAAILSLVDDAAAKIRPSR